MGGRVFWLKGGGEKKIVEPSFFFLGPPKLNISKMEKK